jgi:GNAT superfamily N-acetyltransferase
MTELRRTDSSDPDFLELVAQLDRELAIRDGDDHAFYAQYNKVTMIKHCIVAYEGGIPVGSGAIKAFNDEAMEVKRMYTPPEHRGKRIAVQILNELEKWTAELGYKKCVLETGKAQPEAIALYSKCGYKIIPNYGQNT